MNELNEIKTLLSEALVLVEEHEKAMMTVRKDAYSSGGVGSTAGMAAQLGTPSAEVVLTDAGPKKKKRLEKKTPPPVPDSNVQGIKTTSNGKRIQVTGLTPEATDAYIYGRPDTRQPRLGKKK